jgi:hypothetical protein
MVDKAFRKRFQPWFLCTLYIILLLNFISLFIDGCCCCAALGRENVIGII